MIPAYKLLDYLIPMQIDTCVFFLKVYMQHDAFVAHHNGNMKVITFTSPLRAQDLHYKMVATHPSDNLQLSGNNFSFNRGISGLTFQLPRRSQYGYLLLSFFTFSVSLHSSSCSSSSI